MAVSLEQFVYQLVRSGLMTADELAAFQDALPPQKRPRQAQDLARELILSKHLTRYQAEAVYRGRTKGLVLGDYAILEKIGHGGMGEVYKAQHRRMKRVVAIKLLPPAVLKDEEAVRRFYREVEAAARLNHPNIVTAYDAREHEGIQCLVMEYVEGQDLAALVKQEGPLSVERAVDYVLQAAKGLHYAHQQGVVHRDIKPSNLLLDHEGTVKILDMGLARMAAGVGAAEPDKGDRLTESGQVMGTCDYMAPEQAEDTHAADHRADVYSLGCTLYRLLTGEPPYRGETLIQILLAHREAPIPSLRSRRSDVSEHLEAVWQRMMAKRPEDRQQSMAEVIPELEACLQTAPASPPPQLLSPPVQAAEPSTDSKLTAFLGSLRPITVSAKKKAQAAAGETINRPAREETGVLALKPAAKPAKQRSAWRLVGLGGGLAALAVAAVVAALLAGRGDSGSQQARRFSRPAGEPVVVAEVDVPPAGETVLFLDWPEEDRRDARLEIDGRPCELTGLADRANPDRVCVLLEPGVHTLWIARRGFEPFERRFQIEEGERIVIEPQLRESAAAALADSSLPQPPAEPQPELQAEQQEEPTTAPSVAQTPPPSEAPPTSPAQPQPEPSPSPDSQTMQGELARLEPEEARWQEAIAPVEARAAAWDFAGAWETLGGIHFDEPELAARLAARRGELERLKALKTRIIAAIVAAQPHFTKTDLMLRGVGGEVTGADEQGITTHSITGQRESLAWSELGERATGRLIELVVDRASTEDLVTAGLLALAAEDPASAEAYFEEARRQGMDIGPYLAPLAAAAFARARALAADGKHREADAALSSLEARYAETSWFSANQPAIAAARAAAKAGIYEADAEKLYREAAGQFQQGRLFDVKPLVEQLAADYAESLAVTDASREPSFEQLQAAVADLGRFLTVRQDGKGDFTTIQAAIDAAPPNSLIEIQDNGPYNEKIEIQEEGLTVRGKKGCWPIITSVGPVTNFPILVTVRASGTMLDRVVLSHAGAAGTTRVCVLGRLAIQASIIDSGRSSYVLKGGPWQMESSVVIGEKFDGELNANDSVWLTRKQNLESSSVPQNLENVLIKGGCALGPAKMQFCTIHGPLNLVGAPNRISDCIVMSIESRDAGAVIEHCDVYGTPPFIDEARAGQGCFAQDPQFVNPTSLDYRLLPTSPAIGKASDGGDVGCRLTPEMIEMIQNALELRARGIIKF